MRGFPPRFPSGDAGGGKKPVSGEILTKFAYTYAAGTADTALRQTVTDKDGNTTTYSYDVLNRLVRAETRTAAGTLLKSHAYGYDGNSNRTSMTVDGQTTTYSYKATGYEGAAGVRSCDPVSGVLLLAGACR